MFFNTKVKRIRELLVEAGVNPIKKADAYEWDRVRSTEEMAGEVTANLRDQKKQVAALTERRGTPIMKQNPVSGRQRICDVTE